VIIYFLACVALEACLAKAIWIDLATFINFINIIIIIILIIINVIKPIFKNYFILF
jgi:hypothetical protein